jgi:hypothetical protein
MAVPLRSGRCRPAGLSDDRVTSTTYAPPVLEHDRLPVWFLRAENAVIAALAAVAFVDALFLLFDVSMVDARPAPRRYNAHSYIGPAGCGVVAVVTSSRDLAFVGV